MSRISVRSFVVFAAIVAALSAGCRSAGTELPIISVDQLAALLSQKADVTVVDANAQSTRNEFGVIPGAVLLSSYADYDIATELPSDKDGKLVFYCASTRCSAAPKAAEKAHQAGYTDVSVLAAGIKGWREAGQKVAPIPG